MKRPDTAQVLTTLVILAYPLLIWYAHGRIEPRQLALALLVNHLGEVDAAKALVEPFMKAVVANFGNEWEMNSADVDAALAALSGKADA